MRKDVIYTREPGQLSFGRINLCLLDVVVSNTVFYIKLE